MTQEQTPAAPAQELQPLTIPLGRIELQALPQPGGGAVLLAGGPGLLEKLPLNPEGCLQVSRFFALASGAIRQEPPADPDVKPAPAKKAPATPPPPSRESAKERALAALKQAPDGLTIRDVSGATGLDTHGAKKLLNALEREKLAVGFGSLKRGRKYRAAPAPAAVPPPAPQAAEAPPSEQPEPAAAAS